MSNQWPVWDVRYWSSNDWFMCLTISLQILVLFVILIFILLPALRNLIRSWLGIK